MNAAQNEPNPKPGIGCIQDLVADDFRGHPLIVEDIQARKAMGLRKYGTALQAYNGRNAVMDAYQEALDLVMYLRQGLEEGKPVATTYYAAVGIVIRLRQVM